jgi:hypothetical protein
LKISGYIRTPCLQPTPTFRRTFSPILRPIFARGLLANWGEPARGPACSLSLWRRCFLNVGERARMSVIYTDLDTLSAISCPKSCILRVKLLANKPSSGSDSQPCSGLRASYFQFAISRFESSRHSQAVLFFSSTRPAKCGFFSSLIVSGDRRSNFLGREFPKVSSRIQENSRFWRLALETEE